MPTIQPHCKWRISGCPQRRLKVTQRTKFKPDTETSCCCSAISGANTAYNASSHPGTGCVFVCVRADMSLCVCGFFFPTAK
ncbi:hypothetical protein EXN66_Car011793 [Channa argus]|uniref:Uncharacterized protein n=1 Tax=Channa argus TaxID=215402 RepID=A0A6G1Q0T5_CHAAH|nr:hypothetical protein EXN66_Car011793 [Channa argus]